MNKMKKTEPLQPNTELFNALADEMRLKIMMILDVSEFTVNELKDILCIHQSNASRHLSKLSACGLLKDRRESTKSYYGLSDDLYMSPTVLDMIRLAYKNLPDLQLVKSRIKTVLNERRVNNARKFHKLDETGGSLKAQISLLSHLLQPYGHVVDVGCGEGADLSILLAGRCEKVTAVDIQKEVIRDLKVVLREKGITNVVPLCANMQDIPLPDNSADLVLMSQVLHHAPSPGDALRELIRILRPGGILALLDLAQHNEEELRETHGHIWLGFDRNRIEFLLQDLPCKILSSEIIVSESVAMKALPAICLVVEKSRV